MAALTRLLVIAPTGIYLGRVKTGIDTLLASETKAKETEARVILVAGENWTERDPSYKAKFVDSLKDYILKTWKQETGLNIICTEEVLPMNEEHATGWLLKELYDFFKTCKETEEAEAFIDLTSAPKEWLFAAINILNFFPSVELYYVKPTGERQPKDYTDQREIEDEGHPKPETVRIGHARQPLPRWITPKDEKGKPNVHYCLFETIFELARSIAAEKGLDPSKELDKVYVPIEEKKGLDELRKRFPKDIQKRFSDDSALRKSVSKHLTAVEPFKLFEVKGRWVRMTLSATMLGQALFRERTAQENAKNRSLSSTQNAKNER